MYFSRLSIASAIVAFSSLAAAMPGGSSPPVSQCNTGAIQCCNSVQPATSEAAGDLLGLLGVVLDNLNVLVGITCSPLSVIGAGGDSCNASPVCCENNTYNGLIAIGCVPININL